jgi:hypothetical protein
MRLNRKGQGINTLSIVAIGIVSFVVILFIGFKIGHVLYTIDTSKTPYNGVGCNTTDGCATSLASNATQALLGSNGLGLVKDLAPVAIVAILLFSILGFFAIRGGNSSGGANNPLG